MWVPLRSRKGDIPHMLAVTQAWIDLSCPQDFHTEFVLGSVRADALFWQGSLPFCLEVERSHNDLEHKLTKYLDTWRGGSWRELLPSFPYLLLVVPSPAYIERAEALQGPPRIVCTPSQVAQAATAAYTAARSQASQSSSRSPRSR